ncbi:ABC transporter permease [[Clostridium] dakarense]|uniref:ABC transporter permease n=1 Tax=Faecalimicrobium dakarense TaxID=1301100 RepID=UPI001FA76183|nr:ABC transporter permease [[Clostridium] dakarense]
MTYENSTPSDTQKIKALVQGTLAKEQTNNLKKILSSNQNINIKFIKNKISIDENYIYGDENLSYFDTISPILIGFFVFFFVFLISGISLLKERTSGTLDKLLATPIKRSEIVIGYLVGYGIFAIIQTIIVVLFAVYVLGIKIEGSIIYVLLVNIIIAFIALSFGTLLSTFANSEFQMMQFIPIAIVPQIFFSGLIPVDTMANWLQAISRIVPLYYGATSLQGIIVKGYTLSNIKFEICILILFALVFSLLNVLSLKRYRKI